MIQDSSNSASNAPSKSRCSKKSKIIWGVSIAMIVLVAIFVPVGLYLGGHFENEFQKFRNSKKVELRKIMQTTKLSEDIRTANYADNEEEKDIITKAEQMMLDSFLAAIFEELQKYGVSAEDARRLLQAIQEDNGRDFTYQWKRVMKKISDATKKEISQRGTEIAKSMNEEFQEMMREAGNGWENLGMCTMLMKEAIYGPVNGRDWMNSPCFTH